MVDGIKNSSILHNMLESRENLAYRIQKEILQQKTNIIILFIALFFMYCIVYFSLFFFSIISFYFVFDLSMMITNLKERVKGRKKKEKRENSVFIFFYNLKGKMEKKPLCI